MLYFNLIIIYYIVQTRLKSIQNTKKITDSMKLIASNKIENAEKSLNIARQMGNSFNSKI